MLMKSLVRVSRVPVCRAKGLFEGQSSQTLSAFTCSWNLGDLATVVITRENTISAIQLSTLLVNGWPRAVAEAVATATKLVKFF